MKLIKDYVKTAQILFTETPMYNRNSRVKRSISRLIQRVKLDCPCARNTIKQYYKIYLFSEGSKYPKLRVSNLIILPFMINKRLSVYNGKSYVHVNVPEESIGRYLGEYVQTRTKGKKIIKQTKGRK